MRWLEPAQQVLKVCVAVLVASAERSVRNQPGVRNKLNDASNDVWCDLPGHLRVYLTESAGKWEEDVVFDHGEGGAAACEVVVPRVMHVEGRTVINEPESSVPHQHV